MNDVSHEKQGGAMLITFGPPFLKGSGFNNEPDEAMTSHRGRDTAVWHVTSSVPPRCSVCKADLAAHGEYEVADGQGDYEFTPAGCLPCEEHPEARVLWPDQIMVEARAADQLIQVDYIDRPTGELRTGSLFRPEDAAMLIIAISRAQAWLAHRRAEKESLDAIERRERKYRADRAVAEQGE